jgi:inhibitor of KinA
MNSPISPYRIFPLGDTAVTIDFGNVINEKINKEVLALFHQLQSDPLPGMIEAVPAYSSLTIYYDVYGTNKNIPADRSVYEYISGQLNERLKEALPETDIASRLVTIPVCYEKEFAPDIEILAKEKNISVGEVISIHTSGQYRVYMLGFLPGFSYLGEVDERIAMPRKLQPVTVAAGSIGIAGKQTGIYPLVSPGGWQIIGKTPLKLFETSPIPIAIGTSPAAPSASLWRPMEERAYEDSICLLHPGDTVQFISISKNEFENY